MFQARKSLLLLIWCVAVSLIVYTLKSKLAMSTIDHMSHYTHVTRHARYRQGLLLTPCTDMTDLLRTTQDALLSRADQQLQRVLPHSLFTLLFIPLDLRFIAPDHASDHFCPTFRLRYRVVRS